jgi:phosphoserine aminotransferase
MSRVFNFAAGPATMPLEVLEQVQNEFLDWNNCGASVIEVSHRGKPFIEMAAEAESDLRELLAIPDNYSVLFLQGGAQMQFAAIPLNLMGDNSHFDYVNSGHWSKKAINEGRRYGEVNVVADTEAGGYTRIPPQSEWRDLNPEAAYLHYTPNETIAGVEFHWVPECGSVPLVADYSSTILSRPIDVSRFGLIYAGAQKNIGPSGITIVIVRNDLLGKTSALAPLVFDYQKQSEADSMINTAPTFSWYVSGLVFKWLKEQGGLQAMSDRNQRKALKLYQYIDDSDGYYSNPVDQASRSWMNVPFTLLDGSLDAKFLVGAEAARLHSLKGHRSVGGMRASIYNAMPEEGVDALIAYMQEFMLANG